MFLRKRDQTFDFGFMLSGGIEPQTSLFCSIVETFVPKVDLWHRGFNAQILGMPNFRNGSWQNVKSIMKAGRFCYAECREKHPFF